MSDDQASGLRQWSQAHTAKDDTRPAPAELVIMTWQGSGARADELATHLSLPEGVSRWLPRELVLSAPLPETVPNASWWVLHLTQLKAHGARELAEALRTLHCAGMPRIVLLNAPESIWAPGLISAASSHLGVSLIPDVQDWQQAVTASLGRG